MPLASIVRSAVSTANRVTATLQDTVLHQAWIGAGSYSEPIYDTAISRKALVEYKQRMYKLGNGQEILQRVKVTIIMPVAANGAVGRREPIDSRDKIILPDGTTGPILDVSGVVDPSTHDPYMYVIILG